MTEENINSYFGVVLLDIQGENKAELCFADMGPDENELTRLAAENCAGKPFFVYQIFQPPEQLLQKITKFFLENGVPEEEVPGAVGAFYTGLKGML